MVSRSGFKEIEENIHSTAVAAVTWERALSSFWQHSSSFAENYRLKFLFNTVCCTGHCLCSWKCARIEPFIFQRKVSSIFLAEGCCSNFLFGGEDKCSIACFVSSYPVRLLTHSSKTFHYASQRLKNWLAASTLCYLCKSLTCLGTYLGQTLRRSESSCTVAYGDHSWYPSVQQLRTKESSDLHWSRLGPCRCRLVYAMLKAG